MIITRIITDDQMKWNIIFSNHRFAIFVWTGQLLGIEIRFRTVETPTHTECFYVAFSSEPTPESILSKIFHLSNAVPCDCKVAIITILLCRTQIGLLGLIALISLCWWHLQWDIWDPPFLDQLQLSMLSSVCCWYLKSPDSQFLGWW